MNRQAQAVILLLLGGAVLRASVTDLYLRYVKEGLRPFLIGAGIVLLAAAAMTLWYELRRDLASDRAGAVGSGGDAQAGDGPHRGGDDGAGIDDHGHAHGAGPHREPRVGWLLILPVLGLLLVAPPALGSYAAGKSGTALSTREGSDFAPLPAGDPAKITLLDYASRAVYDQGRSLTDRRVQITAFVADNGDGQPVLARMVLSCCAADARPIKVGLAGNVPTGLPADTWVVVTGTYSTRTGRDPVNADTIPFLDVEAWQRIDPPKHQYE